MVCQSQSAGSVYNEPSLGGAGWQAASAGPLPGAMRRALGAVGRPDQHDLRVGQRCPDLRDRLFVVALVARRVEIGFRRLVGAEDEHDDLRIEPAQAVRHQLLVELVDQVDGGAGIADIVVRDAGLLLIDADAGDADDAGAAGADVDLADAVARGAVRPQP